jgi:two-component system, sporulation sensor kinase B
VWIITQQLVLNFLFLLLSLLIVQLSLDYKKKKIVTDRTGLLMISAIFMLLCMTFPLNLNGEFIYDFRHLFLWFTGLYGGPLFSVILLAISIIYGAILGGTEVITSSSINIILVVFTGLIYKRFGQFSSSKRIIYSGVYGILTAIISILAVWLFFDLPNEPAHIWLGIVFVQVLATLLVAATIETMKKNFELRKRIVQAEKLEAVSHLAASISHEVRNPLTASKGFIQLLQEQETSPHKKEYIKIALEEMDRAEGIIRDYLTFAKPAPEKIEDLNVKREFIKVIDVLRPLANMNSVEIQTSLIPFTIRGERVQFQQCFINLLKNCIEAMPDGGTVYISVKRVREDIFIQVKDEGIGMSKEQLSRLGEPYFSTKEMKGTGLGMMVVFRIIQMLGGTIQIHSEINKGTYFNIKLPGRINYSHFATQEKLQAK